MREEHGFALNILADHNSGRASPRLTAHPVLGRKSNDQYRPEVNDGAFITKTYLT